jgi:hypothetical protein
VLGCASRSGTRLGGVPSPYKGLWVLSVGTHYPWCWGPVTQRCKVKPPKAALTIFLKPISKAPGAPQRGAGDP